MKNQAKERAKLAKKRLHRLQQDRRRRIDLLVSKGMIRDASNIPADAIPIDPTTSHKARVWHPDQFFYQDIEFKCDDCGQRETWTAESQQQYSEVKKATSYKEPKHCYQCRQRRLKQKIASRLAAGLPAKPEK